MTRDRQARIGEAVRAELATLMQRLKDPRLKPAGLLTVTEVRFSQDLSTARVYVSFAGGDPAAVPAALEALARASGLLRGEITRALSLRRAPLLTFLHDTTGEYAAHIDVLLKS
jgi:ribosome-binding factor A